MRSILALAVCAVLLAGCGPDESSASRNGNATAESLSGQTVVKLADGTGLSFSGKLVSETVKPTDKGRSKVYVIDLVSSRDLAEKSVFDVLSKAGYAQDIRSEKDGARKIHYVKKSQPTVGSFYTDRLVDGKSGVRVVLYWQES
jgi:hypothetical protein